MFCRASHQVMFNKHGSYGKHNNSSGSYGNHNPTVEDVTKSNKPTRTVPTTKADTPTFTFRSKACKKHKVFTCGCRE